MNMSKWLKYPAIVVAIVISAAGMSLSIKANAASPAATCRKAVSDSKMSRVTKYSKPGRVLAQVQYGSFCRWGTCGCVLAYPAPVNSRCVCPPSPASCGGGNGVVTTY